MYQPGHFAQSDPARLADLMRDHPLATLIHLGADGAPDADHLPLLWEPQADGRTGRLIGHVARANPLWQCAAGHNVLAVFSGPQGYITPSWYPTKAESGKVVPTWNYAVVHAHGVLRVIDDANQTVSIVTRLTDRHERVRHRPWSAADAPPDYIATMLRAIVGIEILVTRLEGKWKLSQNRSEGDRQGVMAGLSLESDPAKACRLAEWISDTPPG